MNHSEDPSDRLIDSLLREQARRREADDELLAGIRAALDAHPATRTAARPGRKTFLPLAAAAALVFLSVGGIAWWAKGQRAGSSATAEGGTKREAPSLSVAEAEGAGLDEATLAAAREEPLGTLALNEHGKWVPYGGNDTWKQAAGTPQAAAADEGKANASVDAFAGVGFVLPGDESGDEAIPETGLAGSPESGSQELQAVPVEEAAASMDAFAGGSFVLPEEEAQSRSGEDARTLRLAQMKAELERGRSGMPYSGEGSGVGLGAGSGEGWQGRDGGGGDAFFGRADASRFSPELEKKVRPRVIPRLVPAKAEGRTGDAPEDHEQYGRLIDQPWKSPWQDALSTFSIDVDTASYTNVRRMIESGRAIPPDAVRIEECLNYFDYRYAGPKGESAFAVHGTLATCPWKPGHLLARVAIKGRDVELQARPASNLVFLIDVSGSMQSPDKLPLLKRSMKLLLDQLDERDRVGMIVYAGTEGVALDSTTITVEGRSRAIRSIEKLEAGGSTNGGAGIRRAYRMVADRFIQGGVNRVILATDGDFNVGVTGQEELVSLVKEGAAKGVSLSVLGFGTGNFNDAMLEAITNEGNGESYYIDRDSEARRIFLEKLTGTLLTIAKDVKIQVEFNPGKVQAYRLIGYANRMLRHEDFANDKVDAGDIGAGHTVTAFYEIVPHGVEMPDTGKVDALRYQRPAGREAVPSEDWFTLKLRHKPPMGEVSSLTEMTVRGEPLAWEKTDLDFRFASSVALFGMKLRGMKEVEDVSWAAIREMAKPALADDAREHRAEFLGLLEKLEK